MAGPWDKYGSSATVEPEQSGPWQKYAAPSSGPGRGGRARSGSTSTEAPDPANSSLMNRFAGGVDQLTNLGGNRPGQKLKGLHNVITGASEIASPFLLPAVVAAPAATAVGLAGAAAGGALGRKGASMLGASQDVQDLAGDAGSFAGGAAGGRFGPQLVRGGKAVVSELAPKSVKSAYSAARDAMRTTRVPPPYGSTANRLETGVGPSKGQYDAPRPKPPSHPNERNVTRGPLSAPVPTIVTEANKTAATGMAKIMKTHGISHSEAATMTPTEWKLVASNAGLKQAPSPEAIQMAIAQLKGESAPMRVRRRQAGR